MANYGPGANFERDVKKYYEAKGYTVIRSAGSLGAIDLIVFDGYDTILIQCKKERRNGYYAKDIEKLEKVDCRDYWNKEFWVKKTRVGYKVTSWTDFGIKKGEKFTREISFKEFNGVVNGN